MKPALLKPVAAAPQREITLTPVDNARLAALCGPLEQHLRMLENALQVGVSRRGATFTMSGESAAIAGAAQVLERVYAQLGARTSTRAGVYPQSRSSTHASAHAEAGDGALDHSHPDTQVADALHMAIAEARSGLGMADVSHGASGEPYAPAALLTRRPDLAARTPRQREYLRNIAQFDVTFGIGPAGTGKTYLAVACAVDAFERDAVKRIVLVRPAVEAGERLGFLPGDLAQKVDPYLRPLYDALYDLMGFDKVSRLFEKQLIEIAPLAYMRGRTLNHSFIILDEAQNTTPEQMKMFLTRIGFGTKAVVTGDPTQVDLARNQKSGLADARQVLAGVAGVAMTSFLAADVVRHPLVARIVTAYEARDRAAAAQQELFKETVKSVPEAAVTHGTEEGSQRGSQPGNQRESQSENPRGNARENRA
jgi:phosphate starvation-inducible protein PhoH and related proteins